MLSITHNLSAMNADRQFGIVTKKGSKLTEKLSSGYRINRAADDAAGLTISEKMRHQIRGLHQAADNITDGISYVQTAEGALNEVSDMLQRINELCIKSANGTNTNADRQAIDHEVQALKSEMERVFKTTTFNEKQIWPDKPTSYKQVGSYPIQALTFNSTSGYIDVTNTNYDVVAYGNYTINADRSGVNVSWKGYDGNNYQTTTVSWEKLKKNHYNLEMSDYFGAKTASNKLYTSSGTPVFRHKISFTPQESASIDDMIECINGRTFSSSASASWDGTINTSGVSVVGESLSYPATVASRTNGTSAKHNYDIKDTTWIVPSSNSGNLTAKPNATTVSAAKSNNNGWTFSFKVDGIGTVTANSTSISYWSSSETADNDEHIWWEWVNYGSTRRKSAISRSISTDGKGTLANVMDALTGNGSASTPGLLTSAKGGCSDTGGTIDINFNMTSNNNYTYGGTVNSNYVGSFSLRISVSSSDTESSILTKINNALKSSTVLDFASASSSSERAYFGNASAKRHIIDAPIYEGINQFDVHAGTAADQYITIRYDSLRLRMLGLENTEVTTQRSARKSIAEVKSAMETISNHRTAFGAYQNRLEHAYSVDKISEENTQAAESRVRDADMAKLMVDHSLNTVLQQAGISMLSQANSQSDFVLQLLQ